MRTTWPIVTLSKCVLAGAYNVGQIVNGRREPEISAAEEAGVFTSTSPDWNMNKERVEPQRRATQAQNAPLPATRQAKRLRLLPKDYEYMALVGLFKTWKRLLNLPETRAEIPHGALKPCLDLFLPPLGFL